MTDDKMAILPTVKEGDYFCKQEADGSCCVEVLSNTDSAPICDPLKKLKDKIEKLEKALIFYADAETYFAIGFFPDPPCGEFMEDFEHCGDLGYKPGKRARDVLRATLSDAERAELEEEERKNEQTQIHPDESEEDR